MPIVTPNPKITSNLYTRHNLSIFIVVSILIVLIGTFIGSFVYKGYINNSFSLNQTSQSIKNPDDDYKVTKTALPFKTQEAPNDKQVFTLSDQSEFAIEYPKDWKAETRAEDVTKANGTNNLTDKFIVLTKDSLKLQFNFANTADPSLGIPNCYLQSEHKLITNEKYGIMVNVDPEGKINSNFGAIEPIENFVTKDYPETITANAINKDKDKTKISFCQSESTKKLKKSANEFVNIDTSKDIESFTEDELKNLLEVAKSVKGVSLE